MNFLKMMEKVQEVQARMESLQEDLGRIEVEGVSGGGMVRASMTCQHRLNSLSIDPSLVTTDDRGMLEDLIVAAINDAHGKAEETVRERTADIAGEFQLPPGLKLPF